MGLFSAVKDFISEHKEKIDMEKLTNDIEAIRIEEKYPDSSNHMFVIYNKEHISKDEVVNKIKLGNAPYYDFIYCPEKSFDNVFGGILKEDK